MGFTFLSRHAYCLFVMCVCLCVCMCKLLYIL